MSEFICGMAFYAVFWPCILLDWFCGIDPERRVFIGKMISNDLYPARIYLFGDK